MNEIRKKVFKVAIFLLIFTVFDNGVAFNAISNRKITYGDEYEIKVMVNDQLIDQILLYENIPYIPLRDTLKALGKELSYDSSRKVTFIYEPNTPVSYNTDSTDYEYFEEYPGVPTYDSYFNEYQAYPGQGMGSLVSKDGLENRIHTYIGYPIEAGFNIAEYEKKDEYYGHMFYLNQNGEAGLWIDHYTGIERDASMFVGLYTYDAPQITYRYPVVNVKNSGVEREGDLSAKSQIILLEGEAYIDIRQFVFSEEYLYSLALIYEDSTYVPLSFFVCGLGEQFHFNESTKTSYIGDTAELTAVQPYEIAELEIEGEKYSFPLAFTAQLGEGMSLERHPYMYESYRDPMSAYGWVTNEEKAHYRMKYDFSFEDYPMERYLDLYNEFRNIQPDHENFGLQRIYSSDSEKSMLLTIGSSVGRYNNNQFDKSVINFYYDFNVKNSGYVSIWVLSDDQS